MDSPEKSPDAPIREDERGVSPDDPLGMVPAAGKHAARPSEADRRQTLHEYPQTDEEALRREGVELTEDLYRDPPDPTGTDQQLR